MKNLGFCMRVGKKPTACKGVTKNHTVCMGTTKNLIFGPDQSLDCMHWSNKIPCFMHLANQTHACMHFTGSFMTLIGYMDITKKTLPHARNLLKS